MKQGQGERGREEWEIKVSGVMVESGDRDGEGRVIEVREGGGNGRGRWRQRKAGGRMGKGIGKGGRTRMRMKSRMINEEKARNR